MARQFLIRLLSHHSFGHLINDILNFPQPPIGRPQLMAFQIAKLFQLLKGYFISSNFVIGISRFGH